MDTSRLALFILLAASVAAGSASAQPHINSISPGSVPAGTAGFTLVVNGYGFVPAGSGVSGSVVRWNALLLPTTFVSYAQLRATVNYSVIANPTTFPVTISVATGFPNPGVSNGVPFTISQPLPVGIAYLAPASVSAGSPTFVLNVVGHGYRAGGGFPATPPSRVLWNGSPLPTLYVSGVHLRATVAAGLMACAATAQIRVENPPLLPPPHGSSQYSNIVDFAVTSSNPAIASLSPPSSPAGTPGLTLTVTGCNFPTWTGPTGAVLPPEVLWNGTPLPTNVLSPTQVTASVGAALLAAAPGSIPVRVRIHTSLTNHVDSNSATFTLLAPSLATVTPVTIAPMTPASPPVTLTLSGSGFNASTVLHADGAPLPISSLTAGQIIADLGPSLLQARRPGGIALTVANGPQAASNSLVLVVGGGANQGIIRRQPLNPAPGEAYAAVIEGGEPGAAVSMYLDLENPAPLVDFPDPNAGLVCSVYPAGSGALFVPLIEGIGIYGPSSGATLDAGGNLTIPGFVLPNPPYGIDLTVQGIYLDPSAPYGFKLTWARYPDRL